MTLFMVDGVVGDPSTVDPRLIGMGLSLHQAVSEARQIPSVANALLAPGVSTWSFFSPSLGSDPRASAFFPRLPAGSLLTINNINNKPIEKPPTPSQTNSNRSKTTKTTPRDTQIDCW